MFNFNLKNYLIIILKKVNLLYLQTECKIYIIAVKAVFKNFVLRWKSSNIQQVFLIIFRFKKKAVAIDIRQFETRWWVVHKCTRHTQWWSFVLYWKFA